MDHVAYSIDYLRDLIRTGPSVLPWDLHRLPDMPGYRWRQEENSLYLDSMATEQKVAGPIPAHETNLKILGSDTLAYWHYGLTEHGACLDFIHLLTGENEKLCIPYRDPGEFSVEPLASIAPNVELLFPMNLRSSANSTAIYSVKPHFGTVRITEIEWFNNSNPDPGYQWVVKVVREAETNNIIGCGFRIPLFVLDPLGLELLCLVPY